ncbi:MAG: response regulator [Candidatus Schekmanbacteria bacterium]|nr:response regulator [Candidatus Schekmanbacteria bacterium]
MAAETANILVIDGEGRAMTETFDRVLASAGYRTAVSRSAPEALRCVDAADYDVIIFSMADPGASALAILDELKRRRPWLEVVAIAQRPTIGDAKAAIAHGATDVLVQPIRQAELLWRVAKAIERRAWALQRHDEPAAARPEPEAAPILDTWTAYEGDQVARIGIDPRLVVSLGPALYVELPSAGARIAWEEPLARILREDRTIYVIASPVSGTVRRINEALVADAAVLRRPDCWLVEMIVPARERPLLGAVAGTGSPASTRRIDHETRTENSRS